METFTIPQYGDFYIDWVGYRNRNYKEVIEEKDYIYEEPNNNEDMCIICFNPLNYSITLPCSIHHKFHAKCIKKWLETKPNCPFCKQSLDNKFINRISTFNKKNTISK